MRRSLVLLFSFVVGCFACDRAGGDAPAHAAAPAPELAGGEVAAAAPTAVPAGSGEVAQAGSYADDRYPGLLFELLTPPEKTRFVGLGEAELCPCEGTVASLDACLQTETVCELALQVGALMMRMVKESSPDMEITDAAQRYVENARRVWEFDLTNVPWAGAETPRSTMIVFSDFECPHCRELAGVVDRLLAAHGDTLRVYYKQFPLPMHQHAPYAAVAALAAARQGQFKAYHDAIFEHQAALQASEDPTPLLVQLATDIGLNVDRFVQDANDPALQALVDRDRREGITADIMATPTIYVDGVKLLDAYSYEALEARIAPASPPSN